MYKLSSVMERMDLHDRRRDMSELVRFSLLEKRSRRLA